MKIQRATRIEIWTALVLCAFVAGCSNQSVDNRSKSSDLHNEWKRLAGKTAWKEYPNNPIIKPGKRGEWDSWAVMSMSVVKVGDTFHLYYEGGLTGCGDLQVGHATSIDGLHWVKDPANPVLRPGKPGEWDDGATWDPFVLYEDGVFKMWYGGEREGHRSFQCGYAVSGDGTHFVKKGRISNFDTERIADLHICHDAQSDRFYMYYRNWGQVAEDGERLRLAISADETSFDFDKSLPIRIEGEEPGYQYTHVFKEGRTWYMYYGFETKARAGYATSLDGLHWKAQNTALAGTEDAEILKVADRLYFMFYCPEGFQDAAGCDIRLAIFNGDLDGLAAEN